MKFLGKATAACVFTMSAPAVSAASFGFNNLTNNGAYADDGVDQFSFDVTNRGADEVVFTFLNQGPDPATMTRLFWDDNAGVLGDFVEQFTTTPNPIPSGYLVEFEESTNGQDLPGRPSGFAYDFKLYRANGSGGVTKGIDPGENLSVVFQRNGSFQTVLDALGASFTDSSGLRIGVHAQAFADGESNSFISTTPPPGGGSAVPSPTAALSGLVMLGGLVMRRRRRD